MKENLLITKLIKALKNNKKCAVFLKKYNIRIYLFGSILFKKSPNDIDILLLYSEGKDLMDMFNFKNMLTLLVESIICMKADIIFLSYEENKEINFIESENAVELSSFKCDK